MGRLQRGGLIKNESNGTTSTETNGRASNNGNGDRKRKADGYKEGGNNVKKMSNQGMYSAWKIFTQRTEGKLKQ